MKLKPVLFITGEVPAYRVEGLRLLHEREGIEVALTGGRVKHGGPGRPGELPFPHTEVAPHRLYGLARQQRHRAVVVSTAGRLAPLASWTGARRARLPVILWASLWAHPRSPAQLAGYPLLRSLYASADAVVTYGPHVSAYVEARGAHNVHVAPQAVDNAFWGAEIAEPQRLPPEWPADATMRFLFVGRDAPEKGLAVLGEAWREARKAAPGAALLIAGGADPGWDQTLALGRLNAERLRDVYAACDVLIVPSIATRTFREPWGLVVNEAMNRGLAVIASDAVGAAAGELVRNGTNGLVVPAGDAPALGAAIARLARKPQLRAAMGVEGIKEVRSHSQEAWAGGFAAALASLGLSRSR